MTIDPDRLTIAIDMDDTLYDLRGPWLEWIRTTRGIVYPQREYWQPGLRDHLAYLGIEGTFLSLPLRHGAREALATVHEMGVRQVLVSTCVESRTGAWEKQQAAKRDFPFLARHVVITSGAKDIIAADVLIDDAPHNLEAFPGITVKVPHDYNADTSATFTMRDWSEYPGLVERITRSIE